ncbi:MAG: hypothetical protein LLG02_16355 [Pelosinus sp.]|nr:hypothetical protein [Pelosinus sp.]
MNLSEKDIEDILYQSPWLLDERFEIPNVKGKGGGLPGRQVNIGKGGINRFIDLLFKDTRDNRPVIVELKKTELARENIAQILEYRALVVSLDDDIKAEWQDEFGQNYYCPKLILIGCSVNDEVKISANLAGVEVRTLLGMEDLAVDFGEVNQISKRLNEWNCFLKSGNRSLSERSEYVRKIFQWIKDAVRDCGIEEITTIKKLYVTSSSDSWIEEEVYPFLNFPIYYKKEYLCGIYEYFNEELSLSETHVYFDFLIQVIFQEDEKYQALMPQIEDKVQSLLAEKKYNVIRFENGMATIQLERTLLENNNQFKHELIKLISDAIYFNEEIERIYEM